MKKGYFYLSLYAIGLATIISLMEKYCINDLLLRLCVPTIYSIGCPLIYSSIKEYKDKKKVKKENISKDNKKSNDKEFDKQKDKDYTKEKTYSIEKYNNINEVEKKNKPKTLIKTRSN